MLKNQIIQERKKQLGLKIDDIVQYVGVSRPTVCRWLAGTTLHITHDKLIRLAQILQTTPQHLNGEDQNSLLKPILGVVKAGYDMFAEENILGYEEVSPQESMQGDYYLKVQGDSMIGSRIYEGDLLYVKSCHDVESGQIAIVLIEGNEVTVKKVIKKENMLILEASNPTVETRYYTAKEVEQLPIQIIGRVIHNKVMF